MVFVQVCVGSSCHLKGSQAIVELLEKAIEEHFMGEIHSKIWSVASTPEEALEQIRNTPRWDASVRKYAAL